MSNKPYILLFGGFQGSGKTTIIKELTKKIDLPIISLDKIRQDLFDKGVEFSSKFSTKVEEITLEKMKGLISSKQSFVLDTNSSPRKISKFKESLGINELENFSLITILLTASEEELVRRVSRRPALKGIYKGTVPELRQSILKHGSLSPKLYDLVIDTEKHSPSKASKIITSHINKYN